MRTTTDNTQIYIDSKLYALNIRLLIKTLLRKNSIKIKRLQSEKQLLIYKDIAYDNNLPWNVLMYRIEKNVNFYVIYPSIYFFILDFKCFLWFFGYTWRLKE